MVGTILSRYHPNPTWTAHATDRLTSREKHTDWSVKIVLENLHHRVTDLKVMSFELGFLEGRIPYQLGMLTQLTVLDLECNQLTGTDIQRCFGWWLVGLCQQSYCGGAVHRSLIILSYHSLVTLSCVVYTFELSFLSHFELCRVENKVIATSFVLTFCVCVCVREHSLRAWRSLSVH